MIKLASMLGIVIQSDIETEEWFDGLNETILGNSELFTKIDEATVLVEESQFHTINGKLLHFEILWMLL